MVGTEVRNKTRYIFLKREYHHLEASKFMDPN